MDHLFPTEIVMALIIKESKAFSEILTYKYILMGIFFSIGSFFYLRSIFLLGIAVSFSLSQMNVVIATLGSIAIKKEHKTTKEWFSIIVGLTLVIVGGVIVSLV